MSGSVAQANDRHEEGQTHLVQDAERFLIHTEVERSDFPYRSVHCHKVDRQARTMTKQKGRCTAIQRPFLVRLTGFEPAALRVGELGHPAICNDPARKFVHAAQIPALVVVRRKECESVKMIRRNNPKR